MLKKKNGWKKLTDELPPENEMVLCFIPYADHRYTIKIDRIKCYPIYDGSHYGPLCVNTGFTPQYWKHLPKLPKELREQGDWYSYF